jgi:hypothetical protein
MLENSHAEKTRYICDRIQRLFHYAKASENNRNFKRHRRHASHQRLWLKENPRTRARLSTNPAMGTPSTIGGFDSDVLRKADFGGLSAAPSEALP